MLNQQGGLLCINDPAWVLGDHILDLKKYFEPTKSSKLKLLMLRPGWPYFWPDKLFWTNDEVPEAWISVVEIWVAILWAWKNIWNQRGGSWSLNCSCWCLGGYTLGLKKIFGTNEKVLKLELLLLRLGWPCFGPGKIFWRKTDVLEARIALVEAWVAVLWAWKSIVNQQRGPLSLNCPFWGLGGHTLDLKKYFGRTRRLFLKLELL